MGITRKAAVAAAIVVALFAGTSSTVAFASTPSMTYATAVASADAMGWAPIYSYPDWESQSPAWLGAYIADATDQADHYAYSVGSWFGNPDPLIAGGSTFSPGIYIAADTRLDPTISMRYVGGKPQLAVTINLVDRGLLGQRTNSEDADISRFSTFTAVYPNPGFKSNWLGLTSEPETKGAVYHMVLIRDVSPSWLNVARWASGRYLHVFEMTKDSSLTAKEQWTQFEATFKNFAEVQKQLKANRVNCPGMMMIEIAMRWMYQNIGSTSAVSGRRVDCTVAANVGNCAAAAAAGEAFRGFGVVMCSVLRMTLDDSYKRY